MNPLDLPSRKIKKGPEKKVPQFLGIRNEKVKSDSSASSFVTVVVRGIKGASSGEYRVAYQEGQSLGKYLSELKLKRVGVYNAVYDEAHPAAGRCRMTYVPKPGSRVVIGSAAVGQFTHFQRSNHDAQRIAFNMGGGAKVVEVKK